ncbi:YifB family Mg chelatase-like AAA ATPase [Ameyamaea chiangmaiensis]|uniref:YifB family Mg chelatase-like AAA ATPase n=1 Tax=Ameyamaea chiangmaiensis TaxID=442969 RepID=A0A850P311_9PROT|nr:YifB family Mg chelatase-like AAA ATPase [Ameyamaea chiangmaiensis]MBS4073677.1 YifB family Mg chelatase-like AAA ATPase [Ameyamaea chiangmaiensis]NVN39055.1 YifB family Mg chelatase-like AAA ATPase [Ameyamaea chiangmaiensis]
MSITRVQSFAFAGIDAVPVGVEVQIANGLPAFLIVGLADKAVGEARERVRAALTAMGLALPPKRILINLVPADLLKEGSHFDLPIALALLAGMGVVSHEQCSRFAAVGELSLDGTLNPVSGVLSAAIGAAEDGLGLICPGPQGSEARWAGEHIDVLAPPDLQALINHFRGTQVLAPVELPALRPVPPQPDLSDVRGMAVARRALEIAAAGGHSLLLSGPPGAGKSMLAARLPGILPDLTAAQVLEVTRIHSAANALPDGYPIRRPSFRDPHHSASLPALVGGGARARPGDVSLAHHGVLFLDELPEFSRACLESLRQPLETGRMTIARARAHVTYPARFQLVAAMNPCRCGYLGDPERQCSRITRCGTDYQARISGPLMDRLDLVVPVTAATPAEFLRSPPGETSALVRARVEAARARQYARHPDLCNAHASPDSFEMTAAARTLAEDAGGRFGLSARGFTRLFRVARTIADLAACQEVRPDHLAEALSFRHRASTRSA